MAKDFTSKFYGQNVNYAPSLNLMHDLHSKISKQIIENHLMLLEYKPVITYTRRHLFKSLISTKEDVLKDGIDVEMADRGGDVTFHGPGQLVGYPLFYLPNKKVVDFVRTLEKALLKACHQLNLKNATTIDGLTGIFVENKKLISIGIGFSKKTTKHGFAFNLSIDHAPFLKHIIPCGLTKTGITTLKEELLKKDLPMPKYEDVLEIIVESLSTQFSHVLRRLNAKIIHPLEKGVDDRRSSGGFFSKMSS